MKNNQGKKVNKLNDHEIAHSEANKKIIEAIEGRDEPGVREALALGASPGASDKREWAARKFDGSHLIAIELAALSGDAGILRLLLDHAQIGMAEHSASSVWSVALMSEKGCVGVKTMIEAVGAETIKAGSAREMVGWAARGGFEEELRELLRAGAQAGETETTSPLLWAAREGHEGCVKALLEFGADLNEPDEDGAGPLAILASQGYFKGVELLLRYGADPRFSGPSRCTPLHAAANMGDLKCVRLLAPVSDIWARTRDGDLASDLARRSGCEESLALLESLERVSKEQKALNEETSSFKKRSSRPGL